MGVVDTRGGKKRMKRAGSSCFFWNWEEEDGEGWKGA